MEKRVHPISIQHCNGQKLFESRKISSRPRQAFQILQINKSRNVFPILNFFLCFCLFVWQFAICISKYLNYPVATHVSLQDVKETYLPSITVCNNNYRFQSMLNFLSKTNDSTFTGKDLQNYWVTHGIQKELLGTYVVCDSYLQHYGGNRCNWTYSQEIFTNETTVQTNLGQCVDMTLKYPVHQKLFGFAIVIHSHPNMINYPDSDERNYFNIFAHERGILYIHDVYVNIRIPQNTESWTTFERKEHIRLNTPSSPCQDHQDYAKCWSNCVDLKLAHLSPCRLPFMPAQLAWCRTWASVEEAHRVADKLYSTGDIYNCTCVRPCKVVNWKLNRIETMPFSKNNQLFSVELERVFDEQSEEYYVYPFSALVSDMAGIIGFFLGLSLASVMAIIKNAVIKGANASNLGKLLQKI